MGMLTADMRRIVGEQRLGFVATVCPDGTANLSPKGTTAVWDDDHLIFANIRSPGTLANLRQNASVEVNVVDPILRKGYRFKGAASILESGAVYDKAIAFYKERGVVNAGRVARLREPHVSRGGVATGVAVVVGRHSSARGKATSARVLLAVRRPPTARRRRKV